MSINKLTQLQLMRLVSPSLPVGAFAWSQGFESAVELKYVYDFESAKNWISLMMENGVGQLDLPVMKRIYCCLLEKDLEQEQYWNSFLYAARETRELQQEDKQIALAFFRLMKGVCPDAIENFEGQKTYPGLFTRAAYFYQAELEEMLEAFLWAWLENQVAAAGKLVPLGQTDMQKIISELLQDIPVIVGGALQIKDEHIAYGLPGFIHASVLHETQYSRLFRS